MRGSTRFHTWPVVVPNLYQRFTQLSKDNNTLSIYADDTQIFSSSHDSVELANDINSDLENVTDWLNVNKLQSHPSRLSKMHGKAPTCFNFFNFHPVPTKYPMNIEHVILIQIVWFLFFELRVNDVTNLALKK